MKRIITVMSALAMAASLIVPVQAKEEMTADRVKELLYASSIANSEDREELLSYEYTSLEDPDINSVRRLEELGDISKSFKLFTIPPPNERYSTYYDYEEGDILGYFELGSDIRHDEYLMEMPDASGRYIPIMLYGERTLYSLHEMNICPNDSISLDLSRLAETINDAGIKEVTDIRLCWMSKYFYYIKSADGEFAVSEQTLTNRFNDNETLYAWTVYPLGRYFEFETDRELDYDRKAQAMFEKLQSVKVPEEFNIKGDEARVTNYFNEYEMKADPFTDTEGITAKAASLLYDMGVVNGCGDGKFYPSQPITADQANLMLNRLMKNDADYTGGFSDGFSFEDAAYIIFRLLGDWDMGMPIESIIALYPELLSGIESIDASMPMTRGDFAVMVCNALDRNMYTYGIDSNSMGMYGNGGIKTDITLIDYISGRRLNGMYADSKQDGEEWLESYRSWFFRECGDILYEYYGDGRPGLIEQMESCGWERPEQG